MAGSDDLKPEDLILRVIIRLDNEMPGGQFSRADVDEEDFLRRKRYRGTDVPESGISLMRANKFADLPAVYRRVGIKKKATGAAQAKWGQLRGKPLTYNLSGEQQEHISLRCENCDFAYKEEDGKPVLSCKPKGSTSYDDCPLFTPDPLKLSKEFTPLDKPQHRQK